VLEAVSSLARSLSPPHSLSVVAAQSLFSLVVTVTLSVEMPSSPSPRDPPPPLPTHLILAVGSSRAKLSLHGYGDVGAASLHVVHELQPLQLQLYRRARWTPSTLLGSAVVDNLSRLARPGETRKETVSVDCGPGSPPVSLCLRLSHAAAPLPSSSSPQPRSTVFVYENQRRISLFDSFSSRKLVPKVDPPQWSDEVYHQVSVQLGPSWCVDTHMSADPGGWQYASDWPLPPSKRRQRQHFWHDAWVNDRPKAWHMVRRRRWVETHPREQESPHNTPDRAETLPAQVSNVPVEGRVTDVHTVQGYVLKTRSAGFFAKFGFKRRWCVVREQSLFFHKEPGRLATRQLPLKSCSLTDCGRHDEFYGLSLTQAQGHTWYLWFTTDEERCLWFEVIEANGATPRRVLRT